MDSEYPKILGTSTYYTNNMNTLGNDRTSGKGYGYWYNEIDNVILKKLKGKKIPFPFNIFVNDSNIDNFPKDRLFSIYSFFICHMEDTLIAKLGQVDESKSPQEICEALIELANYIL